MNIFSAKSADPIADLNAAEVAAKARADEAAARTRTAEARMIEIVYSVGDPQQLIPGRSDLSWLEVIQHRRELKELREAHPEVMGLEQVAADEYQKAREARIAAERAVAEAEIRELLKPLAAHLEAWHGNAAMYDARLDYWIARGVFGHQIRESVGVGWVTARANSLLSTLRREGWIPASQVQYRKRSV